MGEVNSDEHDITIDHEVKLTATDIVKLLQAKGIPVKDVSDVLFFSNELHKEVLIEDDVDDVCVIVRWAT